MGKLEIPDVNSILKNQDLVKQFEGKTSLEVLYMLRDFINDAIKKVEEDEQSNNNDTSPSGKQRNKE